MDIRKLRVIVFSCVVLIFLLSLLLVKWGAHSMGLDRGNYFPLLVSNSSVVLKEGDFNEWVGKRVWLEGKVLRVEREKGVWKVVMPQAVVLLKGKDARRLRLLGLEPEDLKGMVVRFFGKLMYNKDYGFALVVDGGDFFKVVEGRLKNAKGVGHEAFYKEGKGEVAGWMADEVGVWRS